MLLDILPREQALGALLQLSRPVVDDFRIACRSRWLRCFAPSCSAISPDVFQILPPPCANTAAMDSSPLVERYGVSRPYPPRYRMWRINEGSAAGFGTATASAPSPRN